MSGDSTNRQRLIATYGGVAARLALAISGDPAVADQLVQEAADGARFGSRGVTDAASPDEWVSLLAEVRARAIRTGRASSSPSPRNPGDTPVSSLPIDGATVFDALHSLPASAREVLWAALLGSIPSDATVERLAEALEELRQEIDARRLPGEEDIP